MNSAGRALAELAQQQGVLIEPVDIYLHGEGPPRNHFRLGFAAIPLSAIRPGIRMLSSSSQMQCTDARPRLVRGRLGRVVRESELVLKVASATLGRPT